MKLKRKKGFGILEVLISGVIIIIILAALVFIARAAMNNSEYTQERAQAIYLAQEGIETSRQIRDTGWIDSNSNTKWDSMVKGAGGTYMSVFPTNPDQYYVLLFENYRYILNKTDDATYDSIAINGTTFRRRIVISSIGNLIPDNGSTETQVGKESNAFKVTVEVKWNYNGTEKVISASEVLTNWKPNF